jgi:hypothetical protein
MRLMKDTWGALAVPVLVDLAVRRLVVPVLADLAVQLRLRVLVWVQVQRGIIQGHLVLYLRPRSLPLWPPLRPPLRR